MSKYDLPEDVLCAFDAHQVIDLLAADDPVGAVRIIAQRYGRNGQFALDIATVAVARLDEANDPDCAPIRRTSEMWAEHSRRRRNCARTECRRAAERTRALRNLYRSATGVRPNRTGSGVMITGPEAVVHEALAELPAADLATLARAGLSPAASGDSYRPPTPSGHSLLSFLDLGRLKASQPSGAPRSRRGGGKGPVNSNSWR